MATSRKKNIEIDVVVDDKKAKAQLKGLGDQAGKSAVGVNKLGSATKALGAAFAASQVISFAGDLVDSASNLNESLNAVNVTFGDSADEILQLGKEAATAVGLSEAAFNQFAVGFAAFVDTIASGSGREVGDTMDELTTRIADFASVMNLDVPEAAEKFRSGLAGQTEPLREFGIDVSAATVEQKALEMGLAKTSGELTEQDKILARYQVIMDQTNKVAGDFANTSGELANQQRILNAQWENTKARLGSGLLPVMNEVVGELVETIEAVERLSNPKAFNTTRLGKWWNDLFTSTEKADTAMERLLDVEKFPNTRLGHWWRDYNDFINKALRALGLVNAAQDDVFLGNAPTGPGRGGGSGNRPGGGGGGTVNPNIMHQGGVVPGPRGADVPILAQAGETILPAGHSAGGSTFNITVNAGMGADKAAIGQAVVSAIKAYEKRNGARWRS